MKKYRNTILDPICFLMKGPRTAKELAALLDVGVNNIKQWVARFRAYGLVYVQCKRGRAFVYAWQPSPFFHPDHPDSVRQP